MNARRALSALFLAALAAVPIACQTPNASDSPGTLTTVIFEDVPAPRDARYRAGKGESFSYQSETFRCGRFEFEYPGKPADAADFFRQTMTRPPYNWTLAGESPAGEGGTTLELTKLDDRCAIQIEPLAPTMAGGGPRTSITVRVNVTR